MRPGRLRCLATAVVCLFPGIACADFLPSDFSVDIRLQVVSDGGTIDRSTPSIGPGSDNATVTGTRSAASATGTGGLSNGGLSLGASATADSTGLGGTGLAQVTVLNHFMVTPNLGYTGTTASVSLPFLLGGFLSVGGNSGLPGCADGSGICGNGSADVLASLTILSAAWAGDVSDSIQQGVSTPAGGVLTLAESGLVSGIVPINTSIAVQLFLQTQATAQAFNFISQVGSVANFASTLNYGGTSSDDVTFAWASDQFFAQPPGVPPSGVPEPPTALLLLAGVLALCLPRRRR